MEKLSKNNRNSLILTQHLLIFIYLKYKISCKWFFKDHFFHSKFDGGGEKRNSGLICYYKKCSLKTHQHKIWYFKYTKQNIFSVKIKLFIIFLLKFLHGIKRRRKRRGYKKKIRFHEEKLLFPPNPNPFSLPMEKLSKNNRNSLILTQHLLIFIYLKYKISCKWFFKDHFFS